MRAIRTALMFACVFGFGIAVWNASPEDHGRLGSWGIAVLLNSAWFAAVWLVNVASRIQRPSLALGGISALAAGEFLVSVSYSDPTLRLLKPFAQSLLLMVGAGLVAFVLRIKR
jgi:hypothetical protein